MCMHLMITVMRHATLFFLLIASVLVSAQNSYTTKYDAINVDGILGNTRLLNNYLNCLLDKGRCNEEGKTLKEVVPDALITDCSKCSPTQRTSIEKVIRHLVKYRRADFNALAAKYDPQAAYRSKYQKYLA
ncbi:PREDICTED: ejaculatory bulb-specific protein 3-like [Nicrophorus vespilloides]|uniref:Ejaculatory bulb-specific protein 3-like n=1 Tax=Nicrophorus vespilloides TaxID=110193 RepID=A0ABM1MPE6_NICVS|nr:PREDICTED: ejaculatory bulb-specific protein 3-like [Nicrophorus vespilloides]